MASVVSAAAASRDGNSAGHQQTVGAISPGDENDNYSRQSYGNDSYASESVSASQQTASYTRSQMPGDGASLDNSRSVGGYTNPSGSVKFDRNYNGADNMNQSQSRSSAKFWADDMFATAPDRNEGGGRGATATNATFLLHQPPQSSAAQWDLWTKAV